MTDPLFSAVVRHTINLDDAYQLIEDVFIQSKDEESKKLCLNTAIVHQHFAYILYFMFY